MDALIGCVAPEPSVKRLPLALTLRGCKFPLWSLAPAWVEDVGAVDPLTPTEASVTVNDPAATLTLRLPEPSSVNLPSIDARLVFPVVWSAEVAAPAGSGKDAADTGCVTADPSTFNPETVVVSLPSIEAKLVFPVV